MSSKVIVFCADGTWDGAQDPAVASNVLKLFNELAGDLIVGTPADAEQERQVCDGSDVAQIAKYIHGVGNSNNWLNQAMGGGVGTGLVARLLRGYTFLSRNYSPGDRIVLVGFSRGAYTARALGGFVNSVGLLDWAGLGLAAKSDVDAYQYAAAAWYQYQQQRLQTTRSPNWLSRLQDFAAAMPQMAQGLALKPKFITDDIKIAAIGVWDTVGALGIPELSADHDSRLDLLRFVDTKLAPAVGAGFHAVAIDEQRVDFTPTLWENDPRVSQCLFPGAHADVGGGYPQDENQLSQITLAWMMSNLAQQPIGVRFTQTAQIPAGCAIGPMHLPWTSPGFAVRPVAPREFPPYANNTVRITVAPVLGTRLGKVVNMISATVPPITKALPYFPLALVNAGYVDISDVRANP